jgi:hypothetical protein
MHREYVRSFDHVESFDHILTLLFITANDEHGDTQKLNRFIILNWKEVVPIDELDHGPQLRGALGQIPAIWSVI